MSPFGRKRKDEDEPAQETVEAQVAAGEPDPAAWALPADAGAVTTDAGTAATDAAAAEEVMGTTASAEPEEPAAVAPEPLPEPEPQPEALGGTVAAGQTASSSSWTPPVSSAGGAASTAAEKYGEMSEQRPEVLVAAAFAGAFVFARILKRITSD